MRIDCEQCGAAYAIDDALISDRGVRAQCPKCGTQKIVQKSDALAAPPGGASPFAAPAGPFGGPAPGGFGAPPGQPAASPFAAPGGSPFAAPGGSPFGAPGPGASPFGGASPPNNPFQAPGSPPPSNPFAAAGAPAAPGANPFAAPPYGNAPAPSWGPQTPSGGATFGGAGAPPSQPPTSDPFGIIPPAPPPSTLPPQAAASDDPFSAILTAPPSSDPFAGLGAGPPTSGEEPRWEVHPRGGEAQQGLTLAEVRDLVRSGRLGVNDQAGPMGGALQRVADIGLLAVSLPNAQGPRARGASASRGGFPRPLAAALAVAALAGGGYAAWDAYNKGAFDSASDGTVNPFRRARAQWSLQFPDVDGTSQEHIVEGQKYMRTDTAAGYRMADDHFRMALLLDVNNTRAVAGYVENFAHLPNVKSDPDGVVLAFDGIDWAKKRDPASAELLRAEGALRLGVGQVDEAQRVLVQAQRLAPTDSLTKLLLARTHLERNIDDAVALVREVQTAEPDLKQLYLIAGSAERRLGNFREARGLLKKRLESDAGNVGALKELARLELDLGNGAQAVAWLDKLLDAEQKDVEAHLLRAQVTYQVLRDYNKAESLLSFVVREYEKVAGDLLVPVLIHLAFVQTELGALDAAQQSAERGRELNPNYPALHYVLGRIYQQQGKLDEARRSLDVAVMQTKSNAPLYEPLVRTQLADVIMALGDEQTAIQELSQVIEYAPKSFRGFFALAAVHMRGNRPGPAFTVLRRTLDIDPRQDLERPSLTDFPSSPKELIDYAKTFDDANVNETDEPLLRANEGVIRFHAGQRAKARALFLDALQSDRYNHPALLYLSVLDYEEGRFAGIEKRLTQAERTTAGKHTITQLYLARAEMMGGESESAEKRLRFIIDNEPTLLQARFTLGQLLLKRRLREEALSLWQGVIVDAPDYLPVKRALAELKSGS